MPSGRPRVDPRAVRRTCPERRPASAACARQTTRHGLGERESTPTMNELMKGKRGLIMGVANDHSIAWGVAKALADQGAELAFTYQGEALGKRVKPLAGSVGSSRLFCSSPAGSMAAPEILKNPVASCCTRAPSERMDDKSP